MGAFPQLETLMRRIAVDDGQAYKELFLFYHPRLLQFSFSFTHSKQSAEEITSDVFLKIWLRRKTLMEIENLHLYLYVSTKNLSLNYLAKHKREKTFSIHESKVEFKNFYFDPEQLLLSTEMLRRIQFAVLQLPAQCQLIFKLVKEDGLKYKEVAELLDLSQKTVESQMTIALRKIASFIQFNRTRAISAG